MLNQQAHKNNQRTCTHCLANWEILQVHAYSHCVILECIHNTDGNGQSSCNIDTHTIICCDKDGSGHGKILVKMTKYF